MRERGGKREGGARFYRAGGGCNFQELTYLTTVNLGTLHTKCISSVHFHVADENFFHREARERRTLPPLFSSRSWGYGAVVREVVRGPPPIHPSPPAPLPPCIRFNQNATSVGRCALIEIGRESRARGYYLSINMRESVTTNVIWLILSIRSIIFVMLILNW